MIQLTEALYEHHCVGKSDSFIDFFQTCPDMITVSDLETDTYLDINRAFLKHCGSPREEIIGSPVSQWFLPPDLWDPIKKQVYAKKIVDDLEITISAKDGRKKTVISSFEIIEAGGRKCLLTISKDISRTKDLEVEIARLDCLNLIGEMAAATGHEIRNPMTTVRGLLQLLNSKEADPMKNSYYELMISELDRANSIITEYLSLAGTRMTALEENDLNGILSAIYPLMSLEALDKEILVEMKLNPIPLLLVNKKEIKQLILNIVKNGIDAAPSGSVLTISTYTEENEVVLAVVDRGGGIDPGILAKLGTPFLTNKEGGTGLGMTVCFRIAKKNQARIDVKTGSAGTTVFVRFSNPVS